MVRVLLFSAVVLAMIAPAPAQTTAPANVIGPANGIGIEVPDTSGNLAERPPAQPASSIERALGRYGDPGGLRAKLAARGISYSFTTIADILANPRGGYKQGATFAGRLDMQADADLGRLVGLDGAALHAQGFQIVGRSLSGNNTLDLFTVSNIAAYGTGRLFEAWVEQGFAGGRASLRIGQLAADTEFATSQTATVFLNATFGLPGILVNDLPSGGPAYPLATPGARLRYAPSDRLAILAALFNGNPAGPYVPGVNAFLPELRDLSGTSFRLKEGPLLFAEAQYGYGRDEGKGSLPGTLKLGYVHLFGGFAVELVRIGDVVTGFSGNDFGYLVIDQVVYRAPGGGERGASLFARIAGAPSDRNLIDLYVDAGITFKGLIPGRPDDTFGLSGAYARISPPLARLDAAQGLAPLIRDENGLIEATYQVAVAPGFSLQPDVQYLFHPSAHATAIPNIVATVPLHDALVLGLRATVRY